MNNQNYLNYITDTLNWPFGYSFILPRKYTPFNVLDLNRKSLEFLANIFSRSDKIRFACTKSNLICNFKRVITIEQYCNSNDSLKTLKRQRYFFLQWRHIFSSYYYLLIRSILVRFQEVLYFAFYNLEL